MGSFKASKRNQGPDRRRGAKAVRQRDSLRFEFLERRTLLDAAPTNNTVLWHATTTDVSDVKFGPMANAGADLIGVYKAFQNSGGNGAQVAAQYPGILIRGNSVAVDVQGTGDFNSFLASIQNVGMTVSAVDTGRKIAEGFVPMANLLTLSTAAQTLGLHAVYKPQYSFVGTANNEAETTMNAGTARQQFGVTGAGVTVGVLSDSVNQFQGGLQSSRTGPRGRPTKAARCSRTSATSRRAPAWPSPRPTAASWPSPTTSARWRRRRAPRSSSTTWAT